MSQRAEELSAQLDQEFARMIEFVSGLSGTQLSLACVDSQGSTISAVLEHLRDGTDLVVDWAGELVAAPPAPTTAAQPDPHGHEHEHGHEHAHDHGFGHRHDGPSHEHGHGHDGHVDASRGPAVAAAEIEDTVDVLLRGGADFVGSIAKLSDEQLLSFPPPRPGLSDGTMRLDDLCRFIAADLGAHRAHLQEAVAAALRQPQDAP